MAPLPSVHSEQSAAVAAAAHYGSALAAHHAPLPPHPPSAAPRPQTPERDWTCAPRLRLPPPMPRAMDPETDPGCRCLCPVPRCLFVCPSRCCYCQEAGCGGCGCGVLLIARRGGGEQGCTGPAVIGVDVARQSCKQEDQENLSLVTVLAQLSHSYLPPPATPAPSSRPHLPAPQHPPAPSSRP